jgi:hypothetical protein
VPTDKLPSRVCLGSPLAPDVLDLSQQVNFPRFSTNTGSLAASVYLYRRFVNPGKLIAFYNRFLHAVNCHYVSVYGVVLLS